MFQQPSQLRDSRLPLVLPSGGVRLVTDKTTKNKPRVDYEPRSAHGRAVTEKNKNKARVDYEPHSAHGRAVNKKLFRAYNRASTKNNEAGLERNRFYFCQCVVARK